MGVIGKYIKKGGLRMPFINIKVLKGTLSKEKKDEMIKRVSDGIAGLRSYQNHRFR